MALPLNMLPFQQGVEPTQMPLPFVPGQSQQEIAAQPSMPTEQAGRMSSLVNPVPQGLPVKSAPTSPEDFEQRKAEWGNILTRIHQDPNLQQILLTVGTRLLQGQKPGQTGMGAVGDAIQMGAMQYQFQQQNALENANKQRELSMKEAESNARVEALKANTAQSSQSMRFDAEKQPLTIDKLKLDQRISTLKVKVAEAEEKVQAAIEAQDPSGEKRAKLQLDTLKQKLASEIAQTGAQNASAAAHSANAENTRNKNKAQTTLLDPNSTDEQKAIAREIISGNKSTTQMKKDDHTLLKELFKSSYPEATDAEASRYALDAASSAKGDALKAAITIMNTESPGTEYYNSARDFAVSQMEKLKPPAANKLAREVDITATMAATKLSRAEVLRRLKLEGYTVPEK